MFLTSFCPTIITIGTIIKQRAAVESRAGQQERIGNQRMILPKKQDPRFITIRRGGMLTDPDHQAACSVGYNVCGTH